MGLRRAMKNLALTGKNLCAMLDKAKWKFLTSAAYTKYVSIVNKLNEP